MLPRARKKKPGTGQSKQFENIFCLSEIVLLILLWILGTFFQATAVQLLLIYFVGSVLVIIVLKAVNPSATDRAMDVLHLKRD